MEKCQLYIPDTQITETGPLCWNLFSKKQAEVEKLPPTHGALAEKIMRAHYQAMVWWHDNVPQPEFQYQLNMDGKKKMMSSCLFLLKKSQPQMLFCNL